MIPESPFDLSTMHREFGWPTPEAIVAPEGAGPAMYARLARQKIGASLNRMAGDGAVEVGVLSLDSASDTSEAPLAIVCRFARPADARLLAEAHRLAWNFCHAPLLITIDPVHLRTFSCFVAPVELLGTPSPDRAELSPRLHATRLAADRGAELLHFVNIASGRLIETHSDSFRSEGRADRMLLANLKEVRARLLGGRRKLPVDLAHDLIARLIFIQFLFDRKDANGASALNPDQLSRLRKEGVLTGRYDDLSALLADYGDTYQFFKWLNARFNGDLFPPATGGDGWDREMSRVHSDHLTLLSDLVSGKSIAGSGQLEFWRLYSFDAIPLEFVSSIYDEFVSAPKPRQPSRSPGSNRGNAVGVHYTPTHLVDFVLDAVLPWAGERWDLKILDPACGSGIFLVRAFQRLVHRWKRQHPGEAIQPSLLSRILAECLVGVDIDAHAARVASFSLYLAMCDEIDPKAYWTDVRFPSLRGRSIFSSDFFAEGTAGFGAEDIGKYDLVVGNAPWGKGTVTAAARDWSEKNGWPIANKDIGALFLGKGLQLARDGGRVALIQSAGNLLLNDAAAALRKRLVETSVVEEIVNFTILRFHLFPSATSPACSIVIRKQQPGDSDVLYMCPKLLRTGEDDFRIMIDETDVHFVTSQEMLSNAWIGLMAGGRRDLDLVARIAAGKTTLAEMKKSGDISMREGVIGGTERHPNLRNRRVLFDRDFPGGTGFFLDEKVLERRKSIDVHRLTDPEAFTIPQLLVKQATREPKAVIVRGTEGVVCSQSFVSVHGKTRKGARALQTFCLTYNSAIARYYLAMTDGRMSYRPELRVGAVASLPLPSDPGGRIFSDGDATDINETAFRLFGLREHDRILVEDAIEFAIPELLRLPDSPGRYPTVRKSTEEAGTLDDYAVTFLRVLKGTARRAPASIIIFEEEGGERLPIRMLTVHFGQNGGEIQRTSISSGLLRTRLVETAALLKPHSSSIQFQRVATLFDVQHGSDGKTLATVHLLRPDQRRYWSRSAALRDADHLLASAVFARPDDGRRSTDGGSE
jgi:hypothetical protein